jgi:hypothetical protein
MVMVFLSNNPKRWIHIHNQVENRLEVHLMEDHQEKDHLIETHLKDCHLIHMLDFMDGKQPIQGYSCCHGILKLVPIWSKLTSKFPYQKFQYPS